MPRARLLLVTLLTASAAGPALFTAPALAGSELPRFRTCDALVDYARKGLTRPSVTTRVDSVIGVGSGGAALTPRVPLLSPQARPSYEPTIVPASSEARADASAGTGADEAYSGTNAQEAGVDEPDLAKTDGRRLFVVAGTALWAFDVTGEVPRVISKLDLEGVGGELLLRGDRVLVLGTPKTSYGTVRLVEVDVRDAARMSIARTMTVPGALVSARLTGGTIRVVMSSTSGAVPVTRGPVNDTPAVADAVVPRRTGSTRRPGLSAFVPRTVLRSRRTDRTFRRRLVPCDDVRHPAEFGGLDLLTVLSVDFDRGLFNVDRDAVLASAQSVYASTDSLYVASVAASDVADPEDAPSSARTAIHRFSTTEAGTTSYVASGTVPGFVLGSYSMSEFAGDLRVASTSEPTWAAGAQEEPSESSVSVLRTQGGRLASVGRVRGLGRGERIYAARFIGDVGYLVTFRQTDPLYTLDLRDPTAPKVAGELKIDGYSAYLHPLGGDLLLGIGQDATPQGRQLGPQASVFDVSDPARPRRTAQLALSSGGGSTGTEFDPHAFLWWPASRLAILPVSTYESRYASSRRAAVGITASPAGALAKVGEIVHGPEWDTAGVERSIVVGDRVFSLSDFGVSSNRLPGLQPLGFTAFR